ncbi:acetylxylan esterase [Vibrio sp. E150_011]|uniref:acetylxylan esterase n=1 Tax=Vibrio sp. 10N.261.51.F12 TaxID=3229679 RepID=UPI00354C92B7
MPETIKHEYEFDPTYGYDFDSLLQAKPSSVPYGFTSFWQQKYQQALNVAPSLNLQDTGIINNHWRIFDCHYQSTDGVRIGGWLLLPERGKVNSAIIWAHGYGGIEAPDTSWKLKHTAILIPCFRGISRSQQASISNEPYWHVLHDIQDKQKYIMGGCVQDLWCGISALLTLFPHIEKRIGLIGNSLGGGLSVFASAFDKRISRCHFHVPTFGNTSLRFAMRTAGSTQALIDYKDRDMIMKTLPFFDASCAAKFLTQPTLWGLALFDPYVAPPGQFSIYNACHNKKELFLLDAGHCTYHNEDKQNRELRKSVEAFFKVLGAHDAS